MGIAVTEGSGKTVATETISTQEYGLVKLVDATATSTTRTGVAANPLQVSLANTGTNATPVVVDLGANNDVTVTGTVTLVPATSGGLTTYHLASAGSTNATNVKASAGQLYGYMISNTSAAYSYVAFHNTSGTPTAGSSVFFKIGIPAGGAANVSWEQGIAFSSGIGITTVTGAADSNSTAVAANDLIINLFYK